MEIKLCQIINNQPTCLNTKINAHIKEERLELPIDLHTSITENVQAAAGRREIINPGI